MTNENTMSSEILDNIDIDDFLPMPGADSIVTSPDNAKPKANVFSSIKETSLDFLDETSAKDDTDDSDKDPKKALVNVEQVLNDLDEDLDDDTDPSADAAKKAGRKKIDKSGMVETFSKLIEDGLLVPFDDEKSMEDYSVKDWKELLEANFSERERAIKEQTPKEFFEALPEELQYAAKYVSDGGRDLKGLFRALAEVEQVRDLDVSVPEDQEQILRQYLQATRFGTSEDIEEQLENWKESNQLEKWANKHKPKLDAMHEQIIQSQLDQQEVFRQEQTKKREQFLQNIYETLKPGEINGIKLDSKKQKFLWDELTQSKYESMTGKQTNLLGHLLEKYQFGEEPRYDLIAEALWLLQSPDEYKEQVRQQAKNQNTVDTVRKLKTEESRKLSSTVIDEPEDKISRKIPRPAQNIFKR